MRLFLGLLFFPYSEIHAYFIDSMKADQIPISMICIIIH